MVLRTLAVVFVALRSLIASQTTPQPGQAATQFGQPATDFSLPDSTGSPIKLSAYKGKVVLLDFWATWCTGCKVEIPWYVEFQNKYGKDGLTAIGVTLDDGWKSVKPFLEEHKLNYSVVIANQDLANRYGGLPSLPMTLLIDRTERLPSHTQAWSTKTPSKIRSRLSFTKDPRCKNRGQFTISQDCAFVHFS